VKTAYAIVSGLPKEKILFNPVNKKMLHNKKEIFNISSEKHYHRPISRNAVEKQTLLKEKKKTRVMHHQ